MGSILNRTLDLRITRGRLIGAILVFGVVCRVGPYLADRGLWLDEGMLASNIIDQPIFGPTDERASPTQVYPLGFIAIERALARVLGDSNRVLRLFPMICGVGSLWMFLAVARHVLTPRAVPVALAMFAASDELIYFASELKQYSTDLAASLAAYLLAIEARRTPPIPLRVAGLGALGAALPWFSHTSVFVLAAVGLSRLGSALVEGRRREAVAWAALGVAWASSFAGSYLLTTMPESLRTMMWKFWAFAFPPMPPGSLLEALWIPRAVLNLFVNPLGFNSPIGRKAPALVAFALFLVGCVSMGRRRSGWLFDLLIPLVLVIVASALRLYPFHGRLLLFLVPMLLPLVAEGVDAVGVRLGHGPVHAVLLAVLLLVPTLEAGWHLLEPRARDFSPVGDLRRLDEQFLGGILAQ